MWQVSHLLRLVCFLSLTTWDASVKLSYVVYTVESVKFARVNFREFPFFAIFARG